MISRKYLSILILCGLQTLCFTILSMEGTGVKTLSFQATEQVVACTRELTKAAGAISDEIIRIRDKFDEASKERIRCIQKDYHDQIDKIEAEIDRAFLRDNSQEKEEIQRLREEKAEKISLISHWASDMARKAAEPLLEFVRLLSARMIQDLDAVSDGKTDIGELVKEQIAQTQDDK